MACLWLRAMHGRFELREDSASNPAVAEADRSIMATLMHEIWEEYDEHGRPLPGLCHAGPGGEGFRKLLAPDARLVRTFEAGSHVEAMTIYYRLCGFDEYTTDDAEDYESYPEEWAKEQRGES
jgi:hypothetical protein